MKIRVPLVATMLALIFIAAAQAQTPQPAAAKSRVVMQMSDGDAGKWNLALNNAKNLQADLGAANVEIEIVAYGPGIGMLKSDSPVAKPVTTDQIIDQELLP